MVTGVTQVADISGGQPGTARPYPKRDRFLGGIDGPADSADVHGDTPATAVPREALLTALREVAELISIILTVGACRYFG